MRQVTISTAGHAATLPPSGLATVNCPARVPAVFLRPSQAAGAETKCAHCGSREQSFCGAVPHADFATLSAAATITTIAPRKRIFDEGDIAGDFFIITAGTVKLSKSLPDGRQQITSFAGAGDLLGLASRENYAYCAEAVNEVKACVFSRKRLLALIAGFPDIERRLLESTRHELLLAQEQMVLLGRKTARERVASFLMRLSNDAAAHGGSPLHLHLPMTRQDIADYLGLTIETISRSFTRLRNEKLIALTTLTDVKILDRARIAAIAECVD